MLRFLGLGGSNMDVDQEPEDKEKEQEEGDPNKWDKAAIEAVSSRRWGGAQQTYHAKKSKKSSGRSDERMGAAAAQLCAAPAAPMAMMCMAAMPAPRMAGGGAIGFKTGGAQDVANFRENIEQGRLPLPSDVTFEGMCKSYFFDTSDSAAEPPTELFAPAFSLALAPDPLLAAAAAGAGAGRAPLEREVLLAVGLDSGLTDFKRPRLNLVLLLDVSGSMGAGFDSYYYDGPRGQQGAGEHRTKLDVAKEVLKGMLDKLSPDDSVAISLFSDSAATPKRMGRWGAADAAGVKAGIDALRTVGGTDFQAGLDEATKQLRSYPSCVDGDPSTTESRIIVLTDAQPNSGEISEEGLLSRMKANTADRIYMTLVGVGLDFNSDLVEKVLKVRGANYFSVHTPGEFKQRLEEEFDFMVAPLVFDLELRVDPTSLAPAQHPVAGDVAATADVAAASGSGASASAAGAAGGGWRVQHVYGSPDSEERRLSGAGSIMRIHSLFPSPKTEEGIKGGVVLLRMLPPPGTTIATAPPLRLAARYTDRTGQQFSTLRTVGVPPEAADVACDVAEGPTALYTSTGVRKAVVLARLVDALQGWLLDEWARVRASAGSAASGPDVWDACAVAGVGRLPAWPRPYPQPQPGPAVHAPLAAVPAGELHLRPGRPLLPPPPLTPEAACPPAGGLPGRWERTSQPLAVGAQARAAFAQLLPWLEAEVGELGDEEMRQEVALVRKLAGALEPQAAD